MKDSGHQMSETFSMIPCYVTEDCRNGFMVYGTNHEMPLIFIKGGGGSSIVVPGNALPTWVYLFGLLV